MLLKKWLYMSILNIFVKQHVGLSDFALNIAYESRAYVIR